MTWRMISGSFLGGWNEKKFYPDVGIEASLLTIFILKRQSVWLDALSNFVLFQGFDDCLYFLYRY